MTKTEVINQVYDLAVDGFFNREKFTKNEFKDAMNRWLTNTDRIVIEIALPDGWWHMEVYRLPDRTGRNMWDYYIPDTREQEDRILDNLMARNA